MVTPNSLFEDRAPGELALLTVFILVATYMFVEAGSYPDIIGLYPRVLSGVVLVCGLLLLFQNLLPESLQQYVTQPGATLGASSEISEDIPSDGSESTHSSPSETEETSLSQVILTVLIGGYLFLSYLIGMYFATPIFVFVYGLVYKLGWKMTIGLTLLAWAIAHVFLVVFNAPITSGILL
jgi:hypothetical protein